MNTQELISPRETLRVLPGWMQPFLTWMSGKPLQRQKPLFRSSSALQTGSALISLFGGIFGAAFLLKQGAWFTLALVPFAWLFTVGAGRKIQVTLVHQCAHFNFSGNRKWDRWIGEGLLTLISVDNFDSYFKEHVLIHHTKHLATEIDPDCKFLLELGFKPGMTVPRLWAQLIWTMLSPAFHFKFLRARLLAGFWTAPPSRLFMSYAFQAAVFGVVTTTHSWSIYFWAVFFPLTFLYHIAALLNFSSLHFWLKPRVPGTTLKENMCHLTAGRFLGAPLPESGLPTSQRIWAISIWAASMLLVHLPSRIAVLSGDLPVHDYHHRYPRCTTWADYLYTRQWDLEAGTPGWNMPYDENWGLFAAIGSVFTGLSQLEPQDLTFESPELSKIGSSAMLSQI